MRRLVLMFLVLTFAFFLVLAPLVEASQTGNLKVWVKECDCGNPIEGAKVKVTGRIDPTGYTDSSGYVKFSNLPVGTYDITVSASGYETKHDSAVIRCCETTKKYICLDKIDCSAGFLDEFRCSGKWRQRLYQRSDCTTEWKNYEYCDYECSSGRCVEEPEEPCRLWVSVTTPSDTYIDEMIRTTIKFKNSGDRGGRVSFEAYVCREDGTHCKIMDCNGDDPTIYLSGHETEYVHCSVRATELYYHKIKVHYSGCDVDPTIYSRVFKVIEKYDKCTAGYKNVFRCLGNWRQREYVFSDCTTEWRNYEYCEHGCSNGVCDSISLAPAPTYTTALISVRNRYEIEACTISEFSFEVINVGNTQHTFTITDSGPASEWVYFEPTVILNPNERKTIKAYASVPCDAKGEYPLTLTVSDQTTTSATTFLKVKEEFVFPEWLTWFALGLIVLFLLVLLLLYIIKPRSRCSRCNEERFVR